MNTTHPEKRPGGLIACTGTTTLLIDGCDFANCGISGGSTCGGVFYYNGTGGSASVVGSSFANCSNVYHESVFRIFCQSLHAVHSSTFENCSALWQGAFIMIYPDTGSVMSDCSFSKCQASEMNGGCGAFTYMHDTVTISNTLFQHSSAASLGGAYYFNFGGYVGTPISRFLFFNNNAAQMGNDVGLFPNWKTEPTAERFVSCFSLSTETRVWQCTSGEFPCTTGEERKNLILTLIESDINVDFSADTTDATGDFPECGNDSHPCKTIGYGLKRWAPFFDQRIVLNTTSFVEERWFIGFESPIIVSNISEQTISVETNTSSSNPFCVVTTGSITLYFFHFIHNSSTSSTSSLFSLTSSGSITLTSCTIHADGPTQSNPFTKPLFALSSGLTTLTNTQIGPFIFTETPMFAIISSAVFESKNVTILNTTRKNGNGSVFEKTIVNGETFALNNWTFDNCACQNGNGGAVWIRLQSGGKLEVGNETEVVFNVCKAERGNGGNNVGNGGGMCLLVDDFGSDFLIETGSFDGCTAVNGHNIFIDGKQLKG